MEREGKGGLFTSLLACPRKREVGVGIVADGGTYKNAGFPIKAVGNDSRDPCGNDRLAALPTPLLAFPAPPSDLPPLLLSFPRFLAGIHGRAGRPRIFVIEESVVRLNTGSRGAVCSRGSKGPLTPAPLLGREGGEGWPFHLSHARRSPTVLACPRKREVGVGTVADGGTYKNAGFPIKDVGNDSRDPCGNDRLPDLSAPSSDLSAPLLACAPPSVIPAVFGGNPWKSVAALGARES